MHKLIRELRRREVFRTAGLYVGVAWIVVEVSSVLFDAFEAPEWALQTVIIVAIIGLPVTIVLAWIFDITDHGIEVQAEATETVVIPFGGRRMDFVVIGVLSVALIFSVYLNIAGKRGAIVEEIAPLSVLIADFENRTGDDLFNGTLEQALLIGVEGASFITSYDRGEALDLARQLELGETLDAELARLMAVRQDIDLVLDGIVEMKGSGYRIGVTAISAENGEQVADVSGVAKSKTDVLALVGELTGEIREELGDESVAKSGDATSETFTAASLQAAKHYTTAIDHSFAGEHEQAMEYFALAVEEDPNFGRAYSGWALSAFKLGHQEEAEELWEKALSLMNTMTERERYRTLGLYYAAVTRNYEKAVESFASLVEKYPADAAGHNNLAVASFLSLDFDRAKEEGRAILEIYPESRLYRANYALYAMYSSDFEAAEQQARRLVESAPDYGSAYLPLAVSAAAKGDLEAARQAYRQMAEADKSEHGASVAALGLADIDIYAGDFDAAIAGLEEALQADLDNDNPAAASIKHLAIGQARLAQGDLDAAVAAADAALDLSSSDSRRVPAALIYVEAGQVAKAQAIVDEMKNELPLQTRAYSAMIQGVIHRADGDLVGSIDRLRQALELADLWLIRFELGRSYLAADLHAEALDEFTIAHDRRGEASAVFLDDTPSYRFLATLPYWTGRAQEGLGMRAAAVENYQALLDRWSGDGSLPSDARQRLR
jgi:tetratricopeptide (TPR) repeat protein